MVASVNSMREYLHDKELTWFVHQEGMEEKAWSTKCRIFKFSGSYLSGRPTKTWIQVIRSDLKEKKVNKNPYNGRNAWKS